MHIHTRVYLHTYTGVLTYIHGCTYIHTFMEAHTAQYSSNTLYVLNHCRIRIRIRRRIIEVTLVQYTYGYTCTYIHGSTLSIRGRHSTVQTRNDIY